jgi:raffinose/stachyose/melibiose transport system substrate-binding protein
MNDNPKVQETSKFVFFAASAVFAFCLPGLLSGTALAAEPVEQAAITIGSWRTDDIRQMNAILDRFHLEHPHVRVTFDPTSPPEYDAVLEAQLKGKTAPDLFYLRSFGVSRKLYEQGFLEPLDDLPGLKENFDSAMTAPWTSDDGSVYGVPFIATSHGVYYNLEIFDKLKLQVPQSWERFLETCEKIKANGYIPLANASGDPWTVVEIVFFNLAPNFIGGKDGRMAYLSGERCFDDDRMVSALQAVKDLAPYLPENQILLKYADSLQLFVQGKAAMWMGGSWDIPYLESESPQFEWSVFAPPPPEGKAPHVAFHLDAGMGLNARSAQKTAATAFLQWMTRPEFGSLMGNELPGFFPMHRRVPVLENRYANAFLALNKGRGTDIRLAWEKLREGVPDGYTLMMEAAVAVLNGAKTPAGGASHIQSGFAEWFAPAQHCGK